jgi:hypothetical protein
MIYDSTRDILVSIRVVVLRTTTRTRTRTRTHDRQGLMQQCAAIGYAARRGKDDMPRARNAMCILLIVEEEEVVVVVVDRD